MWDSTAFPKFRIAQLLQITSFSLYRVSVRYLEPNSVYNQLATVGAPVVTGLSYMTDVYEGVRNN